ncbi:class I SAM-dependent methyltransferase [Chloroflexota bacterium]
MEPFGAYAHLYDLDYADEELDLPVVLSLAARCGSPILELGCGTGRLVVPLAQEGYQVTGVDLSEAMIDRARGKVAEQDLSERATLVMQDIRRLELEDRFTLAYSAINSFMHLTSADDQLTALVQIRRHLQPGGLLVLDLFNPDPGRLADSHGQVILDKVLTDPASGSRLMKFHTERVDLGRQLVHVTLFVDRVDDRGSVQRTLFPFTLRYLYRDELVLLLRHAGFELETIYGSYDLDEFTGDSERLIAVAARPV